MNSLRKYRADFFALGAYILLALALTYPLLLNVATHVPGDGSDDPALGWNLWWVPYALINLGTNPIYCDYMFYPIGINLAFYTLTYLNAFLAIPLQYAFNLVLAANVNLWFSFAVSGFGAYLLVKHLLRTSDFRSQISDLSSLAAFVAGALYAFSSNKFLYASLGQFNIASSHWIPFYVLFLLKATRPSPFALRPSLRDGVLLGLFLLFQALSEFIYASFLILFTALYLVDWLLATRPKLLPFAFLLFTFLVAALVFTLPMSPILAAMFQDMATEGDFIQQGLGFADVFASDALGFFVPSPLHPILGGFQARFDFAYTNFAYLGFSALALALLALWRVPRARVWGMFGAIFVLISLGPELRVNGARFDLPLPFDLLLEIPFVKGNRYPSRWSVMVTLALAVLVGYGVAWASSRFKRPSSRLVLPVTFCLLTLFEHLAIPLPLSNFQIPEVYRTIARDAGDFTVLEIPLAWRNGYRMTGTLDKAMMFAQWYQTAHRRPMVGGNTSRNPEFKFQYFTEAPIINSLIAVETGHKLDDATIQRDRQLAPDVLRFFGVRYVVWHSPRDPQNRAALAAARAYVEQVFPVTKFYDATDDLGQTIAYRVNDLPPLHQTTIRPNDPLARVHLGEGWGVLPSSASLFFDPDRGVSSPESQVVWATRHRARVFVRLDSVADRIVSLALQPTTSNQHVSIDVNGRPAGTLSIDRRGEYAMPIAREWWRIGLNEIVLRFDTLVPVASFRYYEKNNSSMVIRSAGSEMGDFAHIFINGVDVSPNRRGYNLVVVNPQGRVEIAEAFDTFASETESARMFQFINTKIPAGSVVYVAVRDEASRSLTAEAVAGLRLLYAGQDLRGKFRWAHAFIGVSSPAGQGLEVVSETMPAQLVIGIGATEPNVAAAVEWIRIAPRE